MLIIDVNLMFAKVAGQNREELIGKKVTDLGFYKNEEDRRKLFKELENKGRLQDYAIDFRLKNSEVRNCLMYSEIMEIEGRPCLISIVRDITEQKRVEKELREAENKNKLLLNSTSDLAMLIDPDGKINAINRSMASSLGHLPDKLLNKNVYDLLPTDLGEQRKKQGKQAEKSGKVIQFIDHKDELWFSNNIYPIFDERKKLTQLAIFSQDVTMQKKAEDALISSEQRLNIVFDSAPDAIYLVDFKGKCLDANKMAEKIFGYKKEDVIGTNLLKPKYLSGIELSKAMKIFALNVLGKPSGPDEFVVNREDGSKIHVETSTYPVKIENKNVILGMARDITARKKMEQELRLSEQRFKHLFDYLGDAVFVTKFSGSDHGQILEANLAAIKQTGYTKKELLKMNVITDLYVEGSREMSTEDLEAKIKKGIYKTTAEMKRRKDGTFFWTEVILTQIDFRGEKAILAISHDITDRINKAEELRKSDLVNKALLNATLDMALLMDKSGNIITVNNAMAVSLNSTPYRLIGKNIEDLLPPELAKKRWNKIEEAGKVGHLVRFVDHQGGRWFDNSIYPIFDDKEKISQYAVFSQDISDLKNAEQELIRSEQRFALAMQGANDGLYDLNIKDNSIYFSPRYKEMLGYKDKEIKNDFESWVNLLHPDDIDEAQKEVNKFQSGDELNYESRFRLKHKDGSYRNILSRAFGVRSESGSMTRIVGTHVDITNLKKAELEILKLNEDLEKRVKRRTHELEQSLSENVKLSEAIEQSHTTVVITDNKGNIEYVNPNFSRVTGYSIEEIKNQNSRILKSGEMSDLFYKELWDTILSGNIWQGEFINRRKNNEFYWESAIISPIFDKNGEITNFVAVKEDISDRKLLEDELLKSKVQAEEANKAKSTFLANMSHEIRTPMNAILGFSEILSNRIKDQSHLDYLAAIQSSGKTLLELINDILDLSKIESGKFDFSFEPCDIKELIKETVGVLKVKSDQKELGLNKIISEELPNIVNIDELRIKQILINLLNNSIKFTDKGHIELEVSCQNKTTATLDLVLKVKDTGIGISEENHHSIFQEFNQIEDLDSKKFEGTGLGLAITKQLVNLMNGTIELESEIGKGSIFTIVLNKVKYSDKQIELKESTKYDYELIKFEETTILVVDDLKSNREVLKAYFEGFNLNIIEAENGEEAIAAIKQYKPQLVFLDLRMPVMDGFETIKIIMKNPYWSKIPIIAVTASAFDTDEKKVIDLGFSEYARKPVSLNEILRITKKYIKHNIIFKDEEISTEFITEIADNLEEVILEIEKKSVPVWKKIKKLRKREKVVLLANILMEIGQNFDSVIVSNYGKELLSASQLFNIKKEMKLIKEFPAFIKELKDMNNKK